MRSLCAALLAFAVAVPAAASTPARLTAFDVNNSQTWAEALALCDLTTFLRTRPSLEADVVVTADPRTRADRILYGPRFMPTSVFFDSRVRLMFERLERAGEVDRRAVGEARRRYDVGMFQAFRLGSVKDMAFLEDQSLLCAALSIDVRNRHP